MANVIGFFRSGRVSMAVVEGEFEGKKTISYTLKKSVFDKETKRFKDSDFYTPNDLMNLGQIIDKVVQHGIKYDPYKKSEHKAEPVVESHEGFKEEVPF